MKKAKSFNKKLNKTIKNKSTLKKCEDFCKNDYMVEMRKVFTPFYILNADLYKIEIKMK